MAVFVQPIIFGNGAAKLTVRALAKIRTFEDLSIFAIARSSDGLKNTFLSWPGSVMTFCHMEDE